MNVSRYIFSQLSYFLNKSRFNDFARKHKGDYYVKHFIRRNQFLVTILGIPLADETPLQDLFNKTNFSDAKKHFAPSYSWAL